MSSSVVGREDGQTKRTLHLRIPPDAVFARTVRDAILGFSRLHGVSEMDIESLLFAVGEALANAIEHSASGEDIEIRAEIDERRIMTTVIDHGRGFERMPAIPASVPEGLIERGRGIPIMQRCTDFFEVNTERGAGTSITLGLIRKADQNTEQRTAS